MLDYKKYKHLSFDVWLTLIKSHPEFKLERAKLLKDFFEIEAQIEDVFSVLKYYDNTCNDINEVTGGNIDTFEIYLLILSKFNKRPSIEDLEKFYNNAEQLFFNYPPILLDHFTKDDFDRIKNQGSGINILSNTGFIKGNTMRKHFDHIGLLDYFDFEIFSDEVNISKPNPKIFALLEQQLESKIDRNLIVHIGDNYKSDYLGAINYGYDAYLIKNEKNLQPT